MGRVLDAGSLALLGVWSIGQLERDRTVATALCFYVPSVVVVAALAVASIRARHARRTLTARVFVLLALVPGVTVGGVENHWARPANAANVSAPSSRLRLVHWNVYGGLAGRRVVVRTLARERGDLTVVSELPPKRTLAVVVPGVAESRSIARRWQLVVIASGALAPGAIEHHGGARSWPLVWTPPGGHPVRILVADLPSDLADARAPHLAWLHERMTAFAPDLVMGDFNAPRRSLGLAGLPDGYQHAYERVGSGYSASFPVPLPLWAIDHTIFGPRIDPLAYVLQTPFGSDHRLQRFDFKLGTGAVAASGGRRPAVVLDGTARAGAPSTPRDPGESSVAAEDG